jgi:hypothetical protein
MNKLILSSILVLSLLPSTARPQPQVEMQITLGLPPRPPLLVIQPGIQVVENSNDEVFFTGGWYWVRRDGAWYRARRPHAAFVWVEPRRVPPGLMRLPPPGHYRHFRREQARAEERAWREHDRAERRERKEREKAERRARKEHGRGHGHGDRDRD